MSKCLLLLDADVYKGCNYLIKKNRKNCNIVKFSIFIYFKADFLAAFTPVT